MPYHTVAIGPDITSIEADFEVQPGNFSDLYPFYRNADHDLEFSINCNQKINVYIFDWLDFIDEGYSDYNYFESIEDLKDWLDDNAVKKYSGDKNYDDEWDGGDIDAQYCIVIYNPGSEVASGSIEWDPYGDYVEDYLLWGVAVPFIGSLIMAVICCLAGPIIFIVAVVLVIIIIVWATKKGKKKDKDKKKK